MAQKIRSQHRKMWRVSVAWLSFAILVSASIANAKPSLPNDRIDPSCDASFRQAYELKQQCAYSIDYRSCQSFGLLTVTQKYIASGVLDRNSIAAAVGMENVEKAMKDIENYKKHVVRLQQTLNLRLFSMNEIIRKFSAKDDHQPLTKDNKMSIKENFFKYVEPWLEPVEVNRIVDQSKTVADAKRSFARRLDIIMSLEFYKVVFGDSSYQEDHVLKRYLDLDHAIEAALEEEPEPTQSPKRESKEPETPYDKAVIAKNLFVQSLPASLQKLTVLRAFLYQNMLGSLTGALSAYKMMSRAATALNNHSKVDDPDPHPDPGSDPDSEKAYQQAEAAKNRIARRAVAKGGAVDLAVVLAPYISKVDPFFCAKKLGLTPDESKILMNRWYAPTLLERKDLLSSCEGTTLTNPQRVFDDMMEKFGGIPKGTCELLKRSMAALDASMPALSPDKRCLSHFEDKHYSLSAKGNGHEFIFKSDSGEHFRLPAMVLRRMSLQTAQHQIEALEAARGKKLTSSEKEAMTAQDLPYFRFSEVEVLNGKSPQVDKFKTQRMREFYRQIHPSGTSEARPDLIDLSLSCSEAKSSIYKQSKPYLDFCKMRKAIQSARAKIANGEVLLNCNNSNPILKTPSTGYAQ